jgi:hypothetical protein
MNAKMIIQNILLLSFMIIFSSCQENINDVENETNQIAILKFKTTDENDIKKYSNLNSGDIIPDRFIVILEDEKIEEYNSYTLELKKSKQTEIFNYVGQLTEKILTENNIIDYRITDIYDLIFAGFTIQMDKEQAHILGMDKRIKSIKNDVLIKLEAPVNRIEKSDGVMMEQQIVPWGVTRVGGPFDGTQSSRKAWIIDTGIDLDNPDLNVNQSLSTSFIGGTAQDGHGHGTHIAGTIGAKNNNIGVVGVAAGATLIGVKTFNAQGLGLASTAIAGLNYIMNHGTPGDVINCSWGWYADSERLDANISFAVQYIADNGFLVTLAAGNENRPVSQIYPAGNVGGTNTFVISAMDSTDKRASFSNYGPSIDFALPGVGVISTLLNGNIVKYDGTSMAAPHMAGMLIYYYNLNVAYSNMFNNTGTVRNDPDGIPDKIPAITNTIIDNFNDLQAYDGQPTSWISPYPYYNLTVNQKYYHAYLDYSSMLASQESLERTIGGVYISVNVRVNNSPTTNNWAAVHMLKTNYNDVPVYDGYWNTSGTFLTIRKNGEIKLRSPQNTINTVNYGPGFATWRHLEIYFNNNIYSVFVDKSLIFQSTYSGYNRGQYFGLFTKNCDADFDDFVVRNTINP